MKRLAVVVLVVGLFLGSMSSNSLAAGPFTLDLGVDYASRYIWRGFDLIPDNNPAIQPWFQVGYSLTDDLTVSYLFWGDYRLTSSRDKSEDASRDNDWDEFDHVVELNYQINDTYSATLGYILYYLPSLTNTQEVYAGVTAAMTENISTSFTIYYDFDEGEGIYARLSFDGTQPVSDSVSLFASAGIGYMEYDEDGSYAGTDGFSDLPLSVGLNFDIGHGFSAFSSINYMFTLNKDEVNDKNEGWLYTGIAYSF